jgi:hypothetical protein
MIGLADAGAVISLSRREREKVSIKLAEASLSKGTRDAAFLELPGSHRIWAINSGGGDGGYCAYWHLDAAGHPMSLIFDFADLALPVWETVRVPLKMSAPTGLITDRKLQRRALAIRFGHQRNQRTLMVKSDKTTKTKIFDSGGQIVFDSDGYGFSICEGETSYHLPHDFPVNLAGELEVQIYLGHRYEIVERRLRSP